jgi:hypothetical protein
MRPTSSLPRRSSNKAAALIIVLAFVVILTGLAVAYLSRATTDRQLAHTSFHDTDADLLARSALDIVVGDFKQEIKNGSTLVSGTFVPNSPANVVPMRSGNPAIPGLETTDFIPNLIRRSVRSDPILAPGVGSRASAVNSTTDVSANGRSVSLAKWNSHYLIPRANPSDTSGDSTPISGVSGFTAPDWVIVTREGAGPSPTPYSAWDPVLKDPTVANPKYAVGRYAYAVYDEGGLLDINVAGYPTSTGASPTATDVGRKGVLAFADLTALPTTPGNYVSTAAINKFILFRNYATTGSTTTLADPTSFTSGQASAFVNYYLGNPQTGTSQDFGQVNSFSSTASGSLRTDQAFISRAELIKFLKSTGIANVNTMQYLGTFSRERNHSTWSNSLTVLANRFPLSRFEVFASTPPTDPAAIQQYFGLVYVPASGPPPTPGHWRYVGTSGTTLLSAIPAVTSTPDLFPLLKYALPSATMGEILSIGASLIDQRDSDPNTTWIEYGNEASPSKAFGVDSIPSTDPAAPPPPPNPILLKRAFRSVGELGYAYRNSSSTLDFHTAGSTDAPLLDLFTYNTAAPAPGRSGIVSLNTRQPRVLAAILKGAIYNNSSSSVVTDSDATTAANSIVNETWNFTPPHGPALSRADIARLASAVPSLPFTSDEEGQDTIARALSEVGQTRTWGLLIDLVAQTGHYTPTATGLADFIVEGEKRYWLHIAIDRFEPITSSGSSSVRVLDQQLEEVMSSSGSQ